MTNLKYWVSAIEDGLDDKPASRESSIARTNTQTAKMLLDTEDVACIVLARSYIVVAELWAKKAPAYAEPLKEKESK